MNAKCSLEEKKMINYAPNDNSYVHLLSGYDGWFFCMCVCQPSVQELSIFNNELCLYNIWYALLFGYDFFCVEKIHLFSTCFLPVCLRIFWNRINRIKWVKNYTDWLVRPQPDTLPKRQVSKTIKCSFLHGPSSYFHGIWWHFEDYTKCTIKKLA